MATVAWSTAMLDLLRAPKTPANYQFLNAWTQREQPTSMLTQSNNPFMTTAGGSATVGPFKAGQFAYWNSFGPGGRYHVAKYPSLEVGVFANAYHIATQFPAIRDAIRSGNPAAYANSPSFQHELTSWSGSGYSSVMNSGAAAGPVGPTVDTGKLGKVVVSASDPGTFAGAVNKAVRHIPGVTQSEGAAGAVGTAVTSTVNAAGATASFLGKLTDPAYILRGLQIVAGGALVAIGAVLLARQVALAADLPGKAGDVVSTVAPVAGVAKKAAGTAAAQTPARRQGRRIEDDARASSSSGRLPAARKGVGRRTETVDAATGTTRRQDAEARRARRSSQGSTVNATSGRSDVDIFGAPLVD